MVCYIINRRITFRKSFRNKILKRPLWEEIFVKLDHYVIWQDICNTYVPHVDLITKNAILGRSIS